VNRIVVCTAAKREFLGVLEVAGAWPVPSGRFRSVRTKLLALTI
jgi:hypothetical protein